MLKPEYYKLYDPYYYIDEESFHKAQESVKTIKNDRDLRNDYLGQTDFSSFSLPFGEEIASRFLRRDFVLLNTLTSLLESFLLQS